MSATIKLAARESRKFASRLVACAIGGALLVGGLVSAAPALADDASASGQQVVAKVIAGLMTEAGGSEPEGGQTTVGDTYDVVASQDGWYEISIPENGGSFNAVGWLPASDVAIVPAAPSALPLDRWVTLTGQQNETGLAFFSEPSTQAQNLGTISKSYVFKASTQSLPVSGSNWYSVEMQDGTDGWMENPDLVAAQAPSGSSDLPTSSPAATDSSTTGSDDASSTGSSSDDSSTSSTSDGKSGITPEHAQAALNKVSSAEKLWHFKEKSYGSLDAVGSPDPSVSIGMSADADGYWASTTDEQGTTWWVSEQATTATSTMPQTATSKGCPAAPAPASTPAPTKKASAAKPHAKKPTSHAAPAKKSFLGGIWSWIVHHMPWWGWPVAFIVLVVAIRQAIKAGFRALFRLPFQIVAFVFKLPWIIARAVRGAALKPAPASDLQIPDMSKMNDKQYQAALAQLRADGRRAQEAERQAEASDDEPLTYPGAAFDDESTTTPRESEAPTSRFAADRDADF